MELAILGLLEEQALHGYELRRRLGETLGFLVSVSFGSLYPALARLEAAGAVVAASPEPGDAEDRGLGVGGARGGEAATRIPMTGSLAGERAAFRSTRVNGGRIASGRATSRSLGSHVASGRSTRQRRVYSITEAGTEMFNQLLAGEGDPGEAEDDRGFALRLAFARHLSPEARLRLLEHRRDVLAQRRARAAATRCSAAMTDTWRAALAERGSEALDGDISWLDRLIEAERTRSEVARSEVARSEVARSDVMPPTSAGAGVVPDPVEPTMTGAGVVPEPVELISRKVPSS